MLNPGEGARLPAPAMTPIPDDPFTRLASHWAGTSSPDRSLAEDTRSALLAARPAQVAEVAVLVEALRARLEDPGARQPARRALFALLDAARRRAFTEAMSPEDVEPWTRLLVPVIDRADYTFGELLRSREETDPRVVAMRVLGPERAEITVSDLARRTRAIARGLLALVGPDADPRVAILSENRLEAALADLACLANGILDFPLPANAVGEHVAYMLRHSGARVLLTDDEEQLEKVLPHLAGLPDLKDVVVFSPATAERHGLLSLEQMVAQASGAFDDAERAARAARVRSRDLASVMYTSGTTGRPKGICFDHLNIVSKRLCRGFALRHVNEGDVFLCYLPLYHTFGRFLEMTGTLWWGATYTFARSTSTASLVEDFRSVRPTVFISVPKKWMELHELAQRQAASDEPAEVAAGLRAVGGGRLRTGLSAAGYLDPIVFRSFHRAGVELCSGYGMTEATGGITMTPPGEYVDGSIGMPLQGIECLRADDGELLIRGAYVSPGYFHPEPGETGFEGDGWFHTGDLVSVDGAGHFRIVGRKKEIYKNRAGQTIAPQRVENLFRDFDDVAQAFLVGDHREYNTLLVWPNYQARPDLRSRPPEEVHQHLSSLVASANRFLAPFERVVAFRLLPRALDEEHGELTHKSTFKRDVVERNWKDLVDEMYQQKTLSLPADGGAWVRVPYWVLRELGVLQQDVSLRDGVLRAGDRSLAVTVDPRAPGSLRLGDLCYRSEGAVVDMGAVLAHPTLWLGNDGLRRFLGEETFRALAVRRPKGASDVRLDPRVWESPEPQRMSRLFEAVGRDDAGVESLHAAGELLRAERPEARRALAHLERALEGGARELLPLARGLLRRCADSPEEEIQRRAFRALIPHEEPERLLETLRLFLDRLGPMALREEDLVTFGERGLSEEQVQVLLAFLQGPGALEPEPASSDRRLLAGVMRLAAAFAIAHMDWYSRVRGPLARLTFHPDENLAARASEEYDRVRRGFQHWVGPNLRLAIDPVTGVEYAWKDVVRFDEPAVPRTRELMLRVLTESTLVRSSVFVLGKGVLLSLADIPPGGATLSLLGSRLGKSVYRLSITTRARETFDVAINLAETMTAAEVRDEVLWLVASGTPPPLVETFGSYHPDWGIYTEEFIPGENVERQVTRLDRQRDTRRLQNNWPFLIWTALAAHVGFWDRTGRRVALRDPSPAAFIVPSHDYHSGARLVSISDRWRCDRLEDVLDRFEAAFVAPVELAHGSLEGLAGPDIRFSAVVEALGLDRARVALEALPEGARGEAARAFLASVDAGGFTPRPVHFAAARFRRWLEVNPAATDEARGSTLGELWTTYQLGDVEQAWPDTRIRFFRKTVFADAREPMAAALDRLMARARTLPTGGLDLEDQLASLREAVRPDAREDYFLARMAFRHLRPGDETALISLPAGDHLTAEVVVGMADETGQHYHVRAPRTPREVARLLQLFQDSSLEVTFGSEHQFLLALDPDDVVLGGCFYRRLSPERVHMEKVVVARKHRGKGIAEGIMRELVRRMRARGALALETGYFQPEFLARFGFRTDPSSGGLVLDLVAASAVRF
jgi:long-subunit acyl-CoA synthetase (AMP-forming)/GNAT superfamily N-acetyltransferase